MIDNRADGPYGTRRRTSDKFENNLAPGARLWFRVVSSSDDDDDDDDLRPGEPRQIVWRSGGAAATRRTGEFAIGFYAVKLLIIIESLSPDNSLLFR